MKHFLKKILPDHIITFLAKIQQIVIMLCCYFSDMSSFMRKSSVFNEVNKAQKLSGRISMACHGIEKGLTMPNRRFGFGEKAILRTVNLCETYIANGYDLNDNQFVHTLSVLDEYIAFHKQNKYDLKFNVINKISHLLDSGIRYPKVSQILMTRNEYYDNALLPFDKFSHSRHSIRDFCGEINLELVNKALKLAQNAPSSCNRQPSRVHLIKEKKIITDILNLHQGNRGFGHMADKILIVTSEIGVYASFRERNAPYVDGGMYGMNLLYALHFYKIGACTLNCNFLPKIERKIRHICSIPQSEVFVMFILIGTVPESFSVALSKRKQVDDILKIK